MNAAVAELHEEVAPLVPSISIDNMLNVRDGILARLKICQDTFLEADAMALAGGFNRPGSGGFRYVVTDAGRGYNPFEREDFMVDASQRLDAAGWDLLMKESGMWSLMDAQARKDWEDKIHNKKVPALNRDNIASTFAMLHDSRGEIFDRGVLHVFKKLSWDYKSHNPFRLGKRLILTNLTSPIKGGQPTHWGYPNHYQTSEVDDLLRVMAVLDGKPEPDHRQGSYSMVSQARDKQRALIEHDYFTIKLHRNGNGHLVFKRMDLVDRMNKIIAKHHPGALPAPRD